MSTQAQEVEQVRRWFDGVYEDVVQTYGDRVVWRRIMEIMKSNPAIPSPEVVWAWFNKMHATNMVMCIRRQADPRSDVVSLRRLLDALAALSGPISRAEFVQAYVKSNEEEVPFAETVFDAFSGFGGTQLDLATINADIGLLDTATHPVVEYSKKQVAHLDPEYAYPEGVQPSDFPTIAELDKGLDAVGHMLVKYYALLFPGSALGLERIKLPYGWDDVFTQAWLVRR